MGQHLDDVARLAGVLHRLVDEGHSVLVVEHHPHLLAACDWLVELGPGGGPEGGRVIAAGTPETVAAGNTPTAPYLREILEAQDDDLGRPVAGRSFALPAPAACCANCWAASDDDPEVRELLRLREADPLVGALLDLQEPDGSWTRIDLHSRVDRLRATSLALARLGYLGFGPGDDGCGAAPSPSLPWQRADGSWPLPESHEETEEGGAIRSSPCRRACPCAAWPPAATPRTRAPSGPTSGCWRSACRMAPGRRASPRATWAMWQAIAGWRTRAGAAAPTPPAPWSAWPTIPRVATSPEARRALDLLLGRETHEQHTLGYEVARLIGVEPARGLSHLLCAL